MNLVTGSALLIADATTKLTNPDFGVKMAFVLGGVVLMGITLSIAVGTWALSPIKFQADMGVLLVFAFMLNMLGSLVLVTALGCFLLRPERSARV